MGKFFFSWPCVLNLTQHLFYLCVTAVACKRPWSVYQKCRKCTFLTQWNQSWLTLLSRPIREMSSLSTGSVISACWATVDWSLPKEWNWCTWADLHLEKKLESLPVRRIPPQPQISVVCCNVYTFEGLGLWCVASMVEIRVGLCCRVWETTGWNCEVWSQLSGRCMVSDTFIQLDYVLLPLCN